MQLGRKKLLLKNGHRKNLHLSPLPSRNQSRSGGIQNVYSITYFNGQIVQDIQGQQHSIKSQFNLNNIMDFNGYESCRDGSFGNSIAEGIQQKQSILPMLKAVSSSDKQKSKKQLSRNSLFRRFSMNQQTQLQNDILKTYSDIQKLTFFDTKQAHLMIERSVQKTLGFHADKVIKKAMVQLLRKQLNRQQAKNYICYNLLISSLTIIRIYHQKRQIMQMIKVNPFKMINEINKNFLGYLKSKYPRSKATFVPQDLQAKFKEINFLSLSENSTLLNAKISFTDPKATRIQTLNKTKKFLNHIMTEIDQKFHYFETQMQDIFRLKQGHFKIGRKIPENTQKYLILSDHAHANSDNMEINSPQILRVMIKWISEMEQLLLNSSEVISKRKQLKCIKYTQNGQIKFSDFRSQRLQLIKTDLIEKISQQKSFKLKIDELLGQLHDFNNSLTHTLHARQINSAYIKEEDAQCLKFAKFNTEFVQWLVVEKFLIIINVLSKLSEYFESKFFKTIDFINFNVYDLLRANFVGKKLEVLKVFEALQKKDKEGILSIVRIKNRLSTPLNDVLINFKLKDCFLICQLQLILMEGSSQSDDKLKITQEINHWIYQLQRSPYGVLAEMSLIITHLQPSIDYQGRIKYNQQWQRADVCIKGQMHHFQNVKDQNTPFVCSWCVKFYKRLQNYFEYTKCKICSLNMCSSCYFQQNQALQKKIYMQILVSKLTGKSIERVEEQEEKDQQYIQKYFRKDVTFLNLDFQRVRDHIEITDNSKISSLEKLLYRKQLNAGLRGTQTFYCLLLHLTNGKSNLEIITYRNYKAQLSLRLRNYIDKFKLQRFDVLFFFKDIAYTVTKSLRMLKIIRSQLQQKVTFITQLCDPELKQLTAGKRQFHYLRQTDKPQKYFLLESRQVSYAIQAQQQNKQTKKRIQVALKKMQRQCTSYNLSKKQIVLQKLGLQDIHLKQLPFQKDIKVLNLMDNRITTINIFYAHFQQLEQLYLSFNFLKDLILPGEKNKLKILDCSHNKIRTLINFDEEIFNQGIMLLQQEMKKNQQLQGQNFIKGFDTNQIKNQQSALSKESIKKRRNSNVNVINKSLLVLRISNNSIRLFSELYFPNLQELDLSNNKIESLNCLIKSELSELIELNISENSCEEYAWLQQIKMPQLRKLQAKKVSLNIPDTQKLNLSKLPKLQFLQFAMNKTSKIAELNNRKLKQIQITKCKITSLEGVFPNTLIMLTKIDAMDNFIVQFPKLQIDSLVTLNLSVNKIKNLRNLSGSSLRSLITFNMNNNELDNIDDIGKIQLPNIKDIFLNNNRIVTLPALNFPILQKIQLNFNKIMDITSLQKSHVPNLNRILIRSNKLTILPKISMPSLTQFLCTNNDIVEISKFSQSYLPSLKTLSLHKNKIDNLPVITFPKISIIYLYNNKLSSVDNLTSSNLKNLIHISICDNKLIKLPKITSQPLQRFFAYKNELTDIGEMQFWDTPNLKHIEIQYNKIQKLPKLTFKLLYQFNLSFNQLVDIQKLAISDLFSLKKLFLYNNKIQKVPAINFPKIEQIDFKMNNISNVDEFFNLSKLPLLKKIILSENKFEELPKTINITSLEEIYLRKNQIKEINCTYNNLINLKKLYLTNNHLKKFDTSFISQCKKLQLVSVSQNKLLTDINISKDLVTKKLYLSDIGIENIGLCIPNVQELYLHKNKLKNIQFLTEPGGFTKLKKINLQQNLIEILVSCYLPNLQELYITDNPIKQYSDFLKSELPQIKNIRILDEKNKMKQTKKKAIQLSLEDKTSEARVSSMKPQLQETMIKPAISDDEEEQENVKKNQVQGSSIMQIAEAILVHFKLKAPPKIDYPKQQINKN